MWRPPHVAAHASRREPWRGSPCFFTLTRIQRELSTTEVVVFQCAHLKRSMSNNDLRLTVAVKAVDSPILSAQNRLVPALVPAYNSSLDPCAAGGSSTHPGVI